MPVCGRPIRERAPALRRVVTARRAAARRVETVDALRAGRPQRSAARRRVISGVTRAKSRCPFVQIDAVDVDVVVPVVERRLDRARQRRERVRPGAGVVVRLVVVGRRQRSPSSSRVSALATSSVPQPVNRSRPTGHTLQPVAAFASSALRSSSHATCSGRERRVLRRAAAQPPRRPAAPRTTCRSRRWNSNGPQSEYGTSAQPASSLDEVGRDRREDLVARRGEVVVDGVAVRVVRHRAVLAHRADADHVRQRRGIVREAPRRRGRLRPVARPPRRRPRLSSTRTRRPPARAASRCRAPGRADRARRRG